MAGDIYSRLQGTGLRLINKYGRTVTLRYNADASPPDPSQPWEPGTPTHVDHVVKGVVTPAEEQFVNHTTILETDSQVIVAAKGLPRDPTPKDLVFDGDAITGQLYKVTMVNPINPGPTTVITIIFMRR